MTGSTALGDPVKAQATIVTANHVVEGALLWVGRKEVDSNGTVDVVMYELDNPAGTSNSAPTNAPGTIITSETFLLSDVDWPIPCIEVLWVLKMSHCWDIFVPPRPGHRVRR